MKDIYDRTSLKKLDIQGKYFMFEFLGYGILIYMWTNVLIFMIIKTFQPLFLLIFPSIWVTFIELKTELFI